MSVPSGIVILLLTVGNSGSGDGRDVAQPVQTVVIPDGSEWRVVREVVNGEELQSAPGGTAVFYRSDFRVGSGSFGRWQVSPQAGAPTFSFPDVRWHGICQRDGSHIILHFRMESGSPAPCDFICRAGEKTQLLILERAEPKKP